MGLVSTGIVGTWSGSAEIIGALALGVSIFNFIYWNCSFIRMGTSGLTAQAYGAGDFHETTAMLVRAVVISLALSAIVLIFQQPLGRLSLWLMGGDEIVADYFFARIWAVPAGILLFGLYGWFVGMQNGVIPMAVSITVNSLHILFGWWFVYSFDLGIVGIAYASVVSQWIGLVLASALIYIFFRKTMRPIVLREVLNFASMKRFFKVNGDIIVRTFCNVGVYTFFTAASARMGDAVVDALLLYERWLCIRCRGDDRAIYRSKGFAFAKKVSAVLCSMDFRHRCHCHNTLPRRLGGVIYHLPRQWHRGGVG